MNQTLDASPEPQKIVSLAEFRRQLADDEGPPPPPKPAAAARRPAPPIKVEAIGCMRSGPLVFAA
jgi:hypothetical protein